MNIFKAWHYWWFYTGLIREKKRAHDLVVADICFLERVKGVKNYPKKIDDARVALKVEQSKDNRNNDRITELATEIAEREETMKKYQRMLAVAAELEQYADIVKLWRNDIWQKNDAR